MMTYQAPKPDPDGTTRSINAQDIRDKATNRSLKPVTTTHNGEIERFENIWPTNFSKGLKHNPFGIVDFPGDFKKLFESINEKPSQDGSTFKVPHPNNGNPELGGNNWRGWESPRCGHVYDLEGPDAGSVGMAPAPRLGSDELAAEMAEVYAMALLRDVPFEEIRTEQGDAGNIIDALNQMPFFDVDSEITDVKEPFTANRRKARFGEGQKSLDSQSLFRGSSPGCMAGPYISQFLLVGNEGRVQIDGTDRQEAKDGYITYGAQQINQRVLAHKKYKDYMTDWESWWYVQNGANLKEKDEYETSHRRFITTPRDLATFVHFDALYQAYLNACLYLLSIKAPKEPGFPEGTGNPETRDAFATFGDPHILTLVTESATRSLKAVRRQKFNHHLRARPEALAAVATLAASSDSDKLGAVIEPLAQDYLTKLQTAVSSNGYSLLEEINNHNETQNGKALGSMEGGPNIDGKNYLLPMAFPEGSPMHPSYGAGHATVAGSCVTILKAFFDMFTTSDGWTRRGMDELGGKSPEKVYVPDSDGNKLDVSGSDNTSALTLEGELNKLAANIAIGRDMAGVHYYSDYYDSLRMGERVAVGLLLEQLGTYNEKVSMRFTSFDDDQIKLYTDWVGDSITAPKLEVNGSIADEDVEAWWARHVLP